MLNVHVCFCFKIFNLQTEGEQKIHTLYHIYVIFIDIVLIIES